jgi:UDP-galactopyranose mutase
MPVNVETVNAVFNKSLQTEEEMKNWLKDQQIPCDLPETSEDVALSRVGKELYEKMFRDYTKKQWAKFPGELDASVLARIPVRTNNDCRYFTDKYQALPTNGYTAFVENMLQNPLITVCLSTAFEDLSSVSDITYKHLIYTGPIDAYFKNAGLPTLEYRSVNFHIERFPVKGFYQPVSVVNYPTLDTNYTRTVEYKHFLHQTSDWTIVVHETTTDKGDPYYPVPNKQNQLLYEQYRTLAEKETEGAETPSPTVGFVGRLASYKYFNMDQAIRTALDFFHNNIRKNEK